MKLKNKKTKTETEMWHRRLKRAVSCMDKSGLWSPIKEVYTNILSSGMTWEDRCRMNELYWIMYSPRNNYSDDEIQKVFSEFIQKYPFVFYTSKDGKMCINHDYIWELSECKLKAMYFGKHFNAQYKEMIKEAISEKKDFCIPRIRVSYDVSFSYVASKNSAWYSEEYRNCGNGHYYIALDHNTALFCEND